MMFVGVWCTHGHGFLGFGLVDFVLSNLLWWYCGFVIGWLRVGVFGSDCYVVI